jgi:DNA polymerase sigma
MGAEVAAFGKWLRHTEAELATRESVIKQTMSIVKKAGTKFTVEPFGSARTGLGLASSDVDLRLFQAWDKKSEQASWMPKSAIPLPPKWKTRRQSLAALQALQTKFMRNPNYILCNIRFARYPLLHLQHAPSGLDVQIVCANDTTTQREWIDRQLTRRPHLADLYAVIKTMLDARGLTDVYRGGLGSYAIFSMIMVVLNKTAFDARTKGRVNSMNVVDMPKLSVSEQLGRDLESIFLFWARFDTYRHAVTVRPVGIWPKLDPDTIDEHDAVGSPPSPYVNRCRQLVYWSVHRTRRGTLTTEQVNNPLRILDKSQPYLLCLEDPNDPTNDLGRQAYGWKHIQQTIKSLSNGIRSGLESKQPEKIKSFLRNLVGTADSDYRTRRAFAEAYGAAAMKSPNGIPPRGSYVKPDNRGHLGTDYRKLIPATYSQDVSDNNSSNSGVDTEPPSSETEIAPQETPLATSEEDVNSVPAADGATSTPSAAEDLAQESRDTDEKAGAAAA